MLTMRFTQSRAGQLLLALLFILGVSWISGEAAQLLLRWRGQKLLADIRTLHAGRSTWSDTQPIMKKWDSWSVPKGACTEEACTYQIDVVQTLTPILVGNPNGVSKNWIARFTDHTGLRGSAVRAGFNVRDGIVITRWFGEQVTPPVRDWSVPDGYVPYVSVSSAESTLFHQINKDQKLLHPHRLAQSKAFYIAVTFSPDEDSAEQAALMDFDFSCITRFKPCESEGQILPEAFSMWQEQQLSSPSR
ncbi:MAG: hypothetical protein M3O31_17960 [Acidobacteriota bacterium]|nr:hypothetical protein [Acidobacteriota bacterium]